MRFVDLFGGERGLGLVFVLAAETGQHAGPRAFVSRRVAVAIADPVRSPARRIDRRLEPLGQLRSQTGAHRRRHRFGGGKRTRLAVEFFRRQPVQKLMRQGFAVPFRGLRPGEFAKGNHDLRPQS
jgi:hypothetical protein